MPWLPMPCLRDLGEMAKPACREDMNGWMYVRERPLAMMNQDSGNVQQKHAQTIADYVGDMVALESHIEEALDRQLTEIKEDPRLCRGARLPRHGQAASRHAHGDAGADRHDRGKPVKAAGAALLGKAAGVIDLCAPKASPRRCATTTRPLA